MQKTTYKITTLSSLIVSPRSGMAFYGEKRDSVGDFKFYDPQIDPIDHKLLDRNRLKVIYPFYRYGEYTDYAADTTDYYLPGSSIKGALFQGEGKPDNFMVDDIPIPNNAITLRNLYKAQYLQSDDLGQACFDIFFENVGVEMVKAQVELIGELYASCREHLESVLNSAHASTRNKMSQMLNQLQSPKRSKDSEEFTGIRDKMVYDLSCLQHNEKVILLGGYKGLLHSIQYDQSQEEIASAIYVDRETMLPHGLVKIEFN